MTPDFSNEYTVIYYGPTETHRRVLVNLSQPNDADH